MVLLAKGAKDNSENTKSEIFSIGATILSAGLLKNFNGIYKKNIFDNNGLTELKEEWLAHPRYT